MREGFKRTQAVQLSSKFDRFVKRTTSEGKESVLVSPTIVIVDTLAHRWQRSDS